MKKILILGVVILISSCSSKSVETTAHNKITSLSEYLNNLSYGDKSIEVNNGVVSKIIANYHDQKETVNKYLDHNEVVKVYEEKFEKDELSGEYKLVRSYVVEDFFVPEIELEKTASYLRVNTLKRDDLYYNYRFEKQDIEWNEETQQRIKNVIQAMLLDKTRYLISNYKKENINSNKNKHVGISTIEHVYSYYKYYEDKYPHIFIDNYVYDNNVVAHNDNKKEL